MYYVPILFTACTTFQQLLWNSMCIGGAWIWTVVRSDFLTYRLCPFLYVHVFLFWLQFSVCHSHANSHTHTCLSAENQPGSSLGPPWPLFLRNVLIMMRLVCNYKHGRNTYQSCLMEFKPMGIFLFALKMAPINIKRGPSFEVSMPLCLHIPWRPLGLNSKVNICCRCTPSKEVSEARGERITTLFCQALL